MTWHMNQLYNLEMVLNFSNNGGKGGGGHSRPMQWKYWGITNVQKMRRWIGLKCHKNMQNRKEFNQFVQKKI